MRGLQKHSIHSLHNAVRVPPESFPLFDILSYLAPYHPLSSNHCLSCWHCPLLRTMSVGAQRLLLEDIALAKKRGKRQLKQETECLEGLCRAVIDDLRSRISPSAQLSVDGFEDHLKKTKQKVTRAIEERIAKHFLASVNQICPA